MHLTVAPYDAYGAPSAAKCRNTPQQRVVLPRRLERGVHRSEHRGHECRLLVTTSRHPVHQGPRRRPLRHRRVLDQLAHVACGGASGRVRAQRGGEVAERRADGTAWLRGLERSQGWQYVRHGGEFMLRGGVGSLLRLRNVTVRCQALEGEAAE